MYVKAWYTAAGYNYNLLNTEDLTEAYTFTDGLLTLYSIP